MKKLFSKRVKIITLLTLFIIISGFGFSLRQSQLKQSRENKLEQLTDKETPGKKEQLAEANQIQLNVPLIDQMDEPSLYNGCEVTSLAMLLQYNGFNIDKNELADDITKVPYDDGEFMGDPNDGFVGSLTADDIGYSAYSPVVIELAEKKIDSKAHVKDLTNQSFDTILLELQNEHPVWVITTTSFEAPTSFETWTTKNGDIKISWDVHSVVLTGFDADSIYLNDPYGEKRTVDRENFKESWEKMGSQAITIIPN